ncbi:hypothetical protein HFO17_21125 [Rhizobium laguerreae]|uniref:hypothetical protein n=1 Tax=Rhizobium laguerreae TaxID=1076926 RepID=UPI001EB9336A|nr:hypothetical protein [Rhizobium laguerreae]MBY3237013.1 hypothetical protein [Rhizobium laguerreae]
MMRRRVAIMESDPAGKIWSEWYAWHPVLPIDDTVFWLETVYRRESPEGRWQYRSFRPEVERRQALTDIPVCPGA